ncbi:MAG: HAD family hydrolase [Oscillospiraceae bacterium]|nr:HAD family hydrolase [Oscillospiraceae bacterium]
MTLFITDLDGTLLNYAAKLKPRATEMLNRMIDKGVLFSYATARSFHSAGRITAELNLKLPLITYNGAIICEPDTGKPLTDNFLTAENVKTALEFCRSKGETPLVYAFVDGVERVSYLESDTKRNKNYLDARKTDKRQYPRTSYDEIFEGLVYYITLINPVSELSELKAAFADCNCIYNKDTYSDDYWFEVYKAGVSKATALLQVKELVGAEKIIAFGDNLNDIPMFEVADECYAVGNAVPELKAIATGIIPCNEEMGVPVFMEKRTVTVWDYAVPIVQKHEQFKAAVHALESNCNLKSGNVGELNEKPIHAALKRYFSSDTDREAKIGGFYADSAGENGIYEIQTSNWGKLNKKLDAFLDASHVTVVYPFEQRVHNIAIHEQTGELLKRPVTRNNRDLSGFFLELYRIKGFLTNPNLAVCLVGLEIEKIRFEDPANPRKRYQKRKQDKKPLALLTEIHLNCAEDYRIFLPDNLPETFTKKQFQAALKTATYRAEASVMLQILEYMSIVHKHGKTGKSGNEFLYTAQLLRD